MPSETVDNSVGFYLPDDSYVKRFNLSRVVEIPLPVMDGDADEHGNDDELVYVDIPKDLIDDPSELCTLLENSSTIKKEMWLAVAVSYALQNKFRQAMDVVRSALQVQQVNRGGSFSKFPFHIFSAWLHLRKASVAVSLDEKEACFRYAAKEVDTALTINPISDEALLARAVLHAQTNPESLDELLEMYEKILKNDSNNVYALYGKAKVFFKRKNYNLALKVFQQILILNPLLKPDSRIGIGLCFWYIGDFKSAANAWERSAELFPDDVTANLLVSIVKLNHAFNESLTDQEFIQNYTGAIEIVAKFCTAHETCKKTPIVLNIMSSYLFSKNEIGLLVQTLNGFFDHNDMVSMYPSIVVSDLYFWLARSYFTIVTSDEKYRLPKDVAALSIDSLLNKTLQFIAKSLRFDKNNIYTKILSGQVQYYKKNINEAILIFENLVKNLELELSNNILKGAKGDAKEKLIEINYLLGLLYHEKVFSEDEDIIKGAVSNSAKKDPKSTILTKENTENIEKSVAFLTAYLKLCSQFKESVIINAHLTLATNYEFLNQIDKVLLNLEKAVELYKLHDGTLDDKGAKSQIPSELLNNIGVFQFLKNNLAASKSFFSLAWDANVSDEQKTTIQYNIARVKENEILSHGFAPVTEEDVSKDSLMTHTTREIQKLYGAILEKSPDYIQAKLRSFYVLALDPLYTSSEDNLNQLDREIQLLLTSYDANLETRAFYGWFIKKFNKRLESYRETLKTENPESKLYKETLVKYDSHDSYSLISLGNIYLLLAREFKNNAKFKGGKLTGADVEKQNNYYIRAAQLYQKVLSFNQNNLFAAQGLAIIFSEMKKSEISLEIFKKIRDSLNDASIFINLGHALIDVKEYSKAIECYEIAINRFGGNADSTVFAGDTAVATDSLDVFNDDFVTKFKNDVRILTIDSRYFTLLGRAWYSRGVGEKSLESLRHALNYSKKAYLIAQAQHLKNEHSNIHLLPSLRFNIAFIYFQIAEFIRKSPKNKRSSEEISNVIDGMDHAIKILEDLSEQSNPPYPATDLKQRAVMGSNTIKTSLQKELEAQNAYEQQFADKILEGKKIREEERQRIEEEQRRNKEKEEQIKEKLKQEREELQKKALEWATELAERNRLAEAQEKKKKDKRVDEDGFVLDEISEEEEADSGGPEADGKKKKSKRKSSKRKKKEEGEIDETENESKKRKLVRKYKSDDFIQDSDEEADYGESKMVRKSKSTISDDEEDEEEVNDNGEDEIKEDNEEKEGSAEKDENPKENGEAEKEEEKKEEGEKNGDELLEEDE